MATAPSSSSAAGADDSLETMIARVNFYESSVEQIKKEFPKYLQHLADTERSHSAMSKVLKSVASAEPNTVLQYVMFLYAQKEEMLAREQMAYKDRVAEIKGMLESWSKLIIHPIRDVITDHQFQLKTTAPIPAPAPLPDSTLSNPTGNVDGDSSPPPAASPSAGAGKKSPAVAASLKTLLPVHMKLFEKHRLKEMKLLLRTMLQNEVQYHAKALEAYAQLLECIADADDRDGHLPI